MPDFLVLKQAPDPQGLASDWTPIVIAREVADEEEAVKQAYSGDGRYKACEWAAPEVSEFDLQLPAGPPTAIPVPAEPVE